MNSHAASNADARIIVVSTSKVCFPRSLSIDITLARFPTEQIWPFNRPKLAPAT
jgi:hypothetical protein